MSSLEIVIKTTNQCNANCVYCSANARAQTPRFIPIDLVDRLMRECKGLINDGAFDSIQFLWHGGEPLLLGKGFFREVLKRQETHGLALRHSIQSNLLNLDYEWIQIFKEMFRHGGGLGSSVDPFFHSRLWNNSDYTPHWLKAMDRLNATSLALGVVFVVHSQVIGKASQVYWFFRNIRDNSLLSLRINPLMDDVGRALLLPDKTPLSISAQQYGTFLMDMTRQWLDDKGRLVLKPVQEVAGMVTGRGNEVSCDMAGIEGCVKSHLGIDYNGAVYNCGRAIDRKTGAFGNLADLPLSRILKSSVRTDLLSRDRILREGVCADCRYWRFCHGGCMHDHEAEPITESKTKWCTGLKPYFVWMEQHKRELAYAYASHASPALSRSDTKSIDITGDEGHNVIEKVTDYCSKGVPVNCRNLKSWQREELFHIARLFISSSQVLAVIEPFYSLLLSFFPNGRPFDLPSYENGRNALEKNHPAPHDFWGKGQTDCLFCAVFKSCRGFWQKQPDLCSLWIETGRQYDALVKKIMAAQAASPEK